MGIRYHEGSLTMDLFAFAIILISVMRLENKNKFLGCVDGHVDSLYVAYKSKLMQFDSHLIMHQGLSISNS